MDKPFASSLPEIFTRVDDYSTANAAAAQSEGVILTTLTSGGDGRAHHKVKEGGYTLRITHSTFGPETRTVRVNAGETSEVHVTLAAAAPEEGDVKKFFKGLFGL